MASPGTQLAPAGQQAFPKRLREAPYKSLDVGQGIPAHLYRAVAEILAYIFKLMNGKLPGQG